MHCPLLLVDRVFRKVNVLKQKTTSNVRPYEKVQKGEFEQFCENLEETTPMQNETNCKIRQKIKILNA